MKYVLHFCLSLLVLALVPSFGFASSPFLDGEIMVMAANTELELDVTMEMLDEDADSSSDITHVIELPVQEMHREQVRNERQIRHEKDGEASPLQQEYGSPAEMQSDITEQVNEAQQNAEEAKQEASEAYGELGQKKGQ